VRTFRIVPILEPVAAAVRRDRRDAFGNADLAPVEVDASPGFPCRVCLEDARVGERVLLFSYSPIAEAAPYRTVGPIFVHENPCRPFDPSSGIPKVLRSRTVALRAYDAHYTALLDIDLVEGKDLEERAERMLSDARVDHVDVHFARAGCYACTLARIPG
jgi:Protein of unknown function (DUF1203)